MICFIDFSHACYWFHVFLCLSLVFPRLSLVPRFSCACHWFSRACHWFHVFPCLSLVFPRLSLVPRFPMLVTGFPALVTGSTFSRACHQLHAFLRLQLVYMFSLAWHCLLKVSQSEETCFHNCFLVLPRQKQILLLGNKIDLGNNASRVAKLGNFGETCTCYGVSGDMFPRFARP